MAERSSAYGRSFIGGVADVAERHPDWELSLIEPAPITPKEAKAFDAWICRIADTASAAALAASNRPVVDCLCIVQNPNFATVRTDADAIGRIAAEHLLARHFANFAFCGYRRIAFSDPEDATRSRDALRRKAFVRRYTVRHSAKGTDLGGTSFSAIASNRRPTQTISQIGS